MFQCIYKLSDLGGNLDGLSTTGDPPLHIMLDKQRRACVIALLNKGAATYLGSGLCTNALHLAIEVVLEKIITVFLINRHTGKFLNHNVFLYAYF